MPVNTLTQSIKELAYRAASYPDLLREIKHPPKHLFVKGELSTSPAIAIIGSRKPTTYGLRVTYRLASELAKAGISIVSGLALGIDSAAHRGALEAAGHTVAVMAGGLDKVYPPSNQDLAKQIIQSGGALISECEVGTGAFKQNFVARNRIIAGLSLGVVVVEASAHSGALITANFALEQNRIVMAVPGNITSLASAGPNNLIRMGAQAVTSASDVLAGLDLVEVGNHKPNPKAASGKEAKILELLESGLSDSEALIKASELSPSEFAQVITLMEISGKIRNLGAGQWVIRK